MIYSSVSLNPQCLGELGLVSIDEACTLLMDRLYANGGVSLSAAIAFLNL